jgi:hypothetical protein
MAEIALRVPELRVVEKDDVGRPGKREPGRTLLLLFPVHAPSFH